MSIYISYHPLDYDFAFELLIYIRNLGLKADLCATTSSGSLDQNVTRADKLVIILRPEYLQSASYSAVADVVEIISELLPVLRLPISITEWSANRVFRPVADFTARDEESVKYNFALLQNVLLANAEEKLVPSSKETYLNNLSVAIQAYNRPIALLEHINYGCDPESELPVSRFLYKSLFKVGTLNRQVEWRSNCQWNKKDVLGNIVEHYKSFMIVCNDVDRSAMAYHLVDMARRRAHVDVNAPIPVLIDIEYWPSDTTWTDWLQSQISFSASPVEDVAVGKCAIYAIGLDGHSFAIHPLKRSFQEWLYGFSPPQYFIALCTHIGNIDDYMFTSTVITPIENNIAQYHEICLEYSDRPFCQFVIKSIEDGIRVPVFNYFLQSPVLAVTLLSVLFEANVDFDVLGVSEYFEFLIRNLWEIANHRNHDDIKDFTEVEDALLRLAALATEQQKANFAYDNLHSLIPSQIAMTKCIDAGILSINKNMIRFSMPMIQEYFAAKALAKFGIPAQLPDLAVDEQFQRLSQRWDKPIIICSHLLDSTDDLLKQVAKSDPLLSLICIISGLPVSTSLYSYVIEQNLNSLTTLGDFRVNFAALLYRVDPKGAKAIFIEILRDAHWQIRLNAFAVFVELETTFLPGLAEAITELTEDTRNRVAQAIHRLGVDALPTLYALLRRDNAKLRLNASWALGELRDKASVPALVALLRDNDINVSKQVIASLDLLQDINCLPYLVKYFNTHHIGLRKAICSAIVHLHQSMPEDFASSVQELDAAGKRSVIQALSGSISDNLVDFLLELSFDDDVDVRVTAIKELGSHPETRVISRLEDCVDDMNKSRLNKSTVSEIVTRVLSNIQKPEPKAEALGKHDNSKRDISSNKSLKSSEIVKARLLQVKETRVTEQDLNDGTSGDVPTRIEKNTTVFELSAAAIADDSYVSSILEQLRERKWTSSSNAARTLREYVKGLHGTASLNVINQILETLNDTDWVIRWTGVETLGWTGNVHVVPHLIQRLTDNNWKVRIAAIRSLSEIGDSTAVAGLSALLSDNNSVVREAAAEALGLLNGKGALEALESAAADQEDFVRLAVIESLGRLRQKSASKILLSALKDKSEHVRWAAANGLSSMASADMVSCLIPSLSDTAGPYWEQKRICDVIVDILKQIGSDEALNAIAGWGNSQS